MQMDSSSHVSGGGGSGESNVEGREMGGGGYNLKRGTKRDASDSDLSDFERFEKRLRMLSLRAPGQRHRDSSSNLYTPISNAPTQADANATPHLAKYDASQAVHDGMQVDDTRDRVYIHDLDAELAELDDDNVDKDRLIFLPDIEKHFSRIPQQVLAGGDDASRELVLYDVPRSLTVDEGHDSVRKAIIESRQRARDKAAEESRQADINRKYDHSEYAGSVEHAHGYAAGYGANDEPDSMDIE